MKKVFISLLMLTLVSCASLEYDKETVVLGRFVDLKAISTDVTTNERDETLVANIKGISASNQTIYYKVDWYKANGSKIKTIMSKWQQKKLLKNIPFDITAVAPSKNAASYRIYLETNIGNGMLD